MSEPPSPTVGGERSIEVVGADEQHDVDLDVDRWCRLARDVLRAEGRAGELTLTFVDRDEITELNIEHMGQPGPTDVLSFPLDDDPDDTTAEISGGTGVPILLGDVVVCPAVAAEQSATHAGTLDDELALLVVHGVLHVLGHDHADDTDATTMRAAELAHLEAYHWGGAAPIAFRQEHVS